MVLLGVATVLFVGAAVKKDSPAWLVPVGLACVSAAPIIPDIVQPEEKA